MTAGQAGLRAIMYAGQPLGEPIEARGPFVMGTSEELDQAYQEYRAQGENFGL
jgi:redox-sensitive bicupin YhaK (pirin superfamily)